MKNFLIVESFIPLEMKIIMAALDEKFLNALNNPLPS